MVHLSSRMIQIALLTLVIILAPHLLVARPDKDKTNEYVKPTITEVKRQIIHGKLV